jgi:hypothetical protein
VNVEFGARDGSYSWAVIDARRITQAFRPDLQMVVKKEYFQKIKENPIVALLWIPNPQVLYSFDGFVDILAHEVLPTQMCHRASQHARIFSPWRISRFGLK